MLSIPRDLLGEVFSFCYVPELVSCAHTSSALNRLLCEQTTNDDDSKNNHEKFARVVWRRVFAHMIKPQQLADQPPLSREQSYKTLVKRGLEVFLFFS